MRIVFFISGLAVLLMARPALSQGPLSDETPSVSATYRFGDEIKIDGRPDDVAWQSALAATRFVQGEPVENAPPEALTEVRVLYDEDALYVAVVMSEPHIARMGDQLVRRDEDGQYDYFELSLDPNSDFRTGYRFRVSAAGVQRDVYLFNDIDEDVAWDAVWQSGVHRDSSGWSAELRIPLSQVRYNASDTIQSWGVNFSRRPGDSESRRPGFQLWTKRRLYSRRRHQPRFRTGRGRSGRHQLDRVRDLLS